MNVHWINYSERVFTSSNTCIYFPNWTTVSAACASNTQWISGIVTVLLLRVQSWPSTGQQGHIIHLHKQYRVALVVANCAVAKVGSTGLTQFASRPDPLQPPSSHFYLLIHVTVPFQSNPFFIYSSSQLFLFRKSNSFSPASSLFLIHESFLQIPFDCQLPRGNPVFDTSA